MERKVETWERSFLSLIFKIKHWYIFDLSHPALSPAKKKLASCRRSLIFRIISENFSKSIWVVTLKLYDVYLNKVNINEIFSDSQRRSPTAFLLLRIFTRTLIESTRTWKIFKKIQIFHGLPFSTSLERQNLILQDIFMSYVAGLVWNENDK